MITSEFFLPSCDGKTLLHVNQWTPVSVPIRGVVQIAHGIAEYGARYAPFAAFLAKNGYVVVAHDHLGHGQSVAPGAPRLYFAAENGWETVVDDMEKLRQRISSLYPEVPYFLFGHSMGSFLTRTHLIRYPGSVKGAILCGTGWQPPLLIKAGTAVVNREIRRLGDTAFSPKVQDLVFGSYNKAFAPQRTPYDWISKSKENVDAYLADPYCGEPITVGLFRDLLHGLSIVCNEKNFPEMDRNLSLLLISGDMDPVGSMGKGVEKTRNALRKNGLSDVTMKLYHELRHEILNEHTSRFIMKDVLDWLTVRS